MSESIQNETNDSKHTKCCNVLFHQRDIGQFHVALGNVVFKTRSLVQQHIYKYQQARNPFDDDWKVVVDSVSKALEHLCIAEAAYFRHAGDVTEHDIHMLTEIIYGKAIEMENE